MENDIGPVDPIYTPSSTLADKLKDKKVIIGVILFLLLIILAVIYAQMNKSRQEAEINTVVQNTNAPQNQYDPSIPTPTYSPEVIEAIQDQQQAQDEYNNWQANTRAEFPWRKHLPLHTEKHYVYFDLEKQSFVGYIYPTASENPEVMKGEILTELKSFNVPLDDFPFEWIVTPE